MRAMLRKGEVESVLSELMHQEHGKDCECRHFAELAKKHADEVAKLFEWASHSLNNTGLPGPLLMLMGPAITDALCDVLMAGIKIGRRQALDEAMPK